MTYQLIKNDILKWAAGYTGPKFHALFGDPPYHLTIPKRFGKPGSAPAKGDVYNRSSKGFMGQTWDGGDIAFNPETWAALGEHLHDGAFGMAFASSRGWHRLAVAIEDSGMIIHPSIFGWCFLSGFPKATRVKNKIFEGYRYGLQAMKPALEPIILFQKPYTGRPVDCITQTGAGALNIDGGRVGLEERQNRQSGFVRRGRTDEEVFFGNDTNRPDEELDPVLGRWPANLILDEAGSELLDRQSGILTSGGPAKTRGAIDDFWTGKAPRPDNPETYNGGDSGGASRMFFRSHWSYEILEQLANADPVRYEPKVSTAEREAGLDELPERLRHRVNAGGLENEPRFAPVKLKNHHPTLKPISLTKYLTTLLLPPDTYAPRRILVPFAGSGSEMIGAILTGWDEVIGVEASPEYIPIAEARLKWWSQWPGWGQRDVEKILASLNTERDQRQLGLFEAA